MAYVFETQQAATISYNGNNKLTLKGINGSEQDASKIMNGIELLLSIGQIQSRYVATTAVRTVKQNVNEQ